MKIVSIDAARQQNAREAARLRKWEKAQERKKNKGEKSKTLKGSETNA